MKSKEELDDKDVFLLARTFKPLPTRAQMQEKKRETSYRRASNLMCFIRRKPGHIKKDCPHFDNNKFKYKKKLICVTWDEVDKVKAMKTRTKKKNPLVASLIFSIR